MLAQAAETDYPVLLLGESGTGKQAAAEWIHQQSIRKRKPFLDVNVSCWNNNSMIHSLLFGHERGSFTGAMKRHPGYFEQAHEGTLFLDEIGDLDPMIQPILLKVLDQGKILPLGAQSPKWVDTRLISATNQDLEQAVQQGRFRRDLLARLSCLTIRLPSLREREEDLELLWQERCRHHKLELPLTAQLKQHLLEEGLEDNLRGLDRILIRQSVWGRMDYASTVRSASSNVKA
jgi:DNA-binding NtrC family response regulator